MIAANTWRQPDFHWLADEAYDLCLRHAADAAQIALGLRRRAGGNEQADLAAFVEGALRELLYASPVPPELYSFAHEEEREDLARAVDQGCRRARARLNGSLDESSWRGLQMAILYRFAW